MNIDWLAFLFLGAVIMVVGIAVGTVLAKRPTTETVKCGICSEPFSKRNPGKIARYPIHTMWVRSWTVGRVHDECHKLATEEPKKPEPARVEVTA